MVKRNLVLDILVFMILILCSLMIDAVAASSSPSPPPSLSKPPCRDRCGDITIPYPFGMDRPECFLDEWYEIECQNETIPILSPRLNLTVLNISLPRTWREGRGYYSENGYVTVNYPIIYSNYSYCSADVTSAPPTLPSLKRSPFSFSSWNAFNAVGCNVSAMMRGSNRSFTGCMLEECSGGDDISTCRTTDLSDDLQKLDVFFTNDRSKDAAGMDDGQCNYAFLANESWLQSSLPNLTLLKAGGFARVALNWGISNTSELAKELYDRYESDRGYSLDSSWGYENGTKTVWSFRCEYGYDGNPYLSDGCQDINECEDPSIHCSRRCVNTPGSYHCEDPWKKLKFVVIGISSGVGVLLLVLLGWWLYRIIKKRKEKKLKEKNFKRNGGLLLQQQLLSPEGHLQKGKLFAEKELQKATENFNESRILGKGGQGTVYKGMLTDGRIVAIKKALVIDEGNIEQFINEVMILSQINHRNIVKLLGCCLESEVPLLVYEFIPNGNLYEYLHESNDEYLVSWEVRLQLAMEIAGALFYLHSAASMPIYHRDIKSTNILLDEKYRAKIADFGTSRSVPLDQTHVTTLVQGTIGYLDPEYFHTYQLTDKSDVYSFGVVLVELLTGQKPFSTIRTEEGRNLATHYILSMESGHLFDILDTQVLNQGKEEEILIVAHLARRCLQLSGRNRPTMKEVTVELEGIKKLQNLPNIQESEENCLQIQCQDIFSSAPASTITSSSDVQPFLHDKTW